MTKKMGVAIAVLAFALMLGCGKAPETEMMNAESAIKAAGEAEAEQYAPQDYQMAMDTLNAAKTEAETQASKFALFRSYGKAKKLYESAQSLADNALAKSTSEKERISAEVADMMESVKTLLDSASTAVSKAPLGKGSKADIELIKADLKAAYTAFDEAKVDFENSRYLNARAKLEAVNQKSKAIINEIHKAASMKKSK